MASKPSRTTNFSEQEKLLLAELGRDFPEVESKGYDSKTLAKKTKAWEKILTKFNYQNLNGIKRNLSQLQGCWRQLKLQSKKEHDLHRREARRQLLNLLEQEFDDDAEEELDLKRDIDEVEVITYEVGPSLLAEVEAISRKGAAKSQKRRLVRSTITFNRF